VLKEAAYNVAHMGSTKYAMKIVIKNPERRRNIKDIAVCEILILKQT
jgi:hypothetical protein